MGEAAAKLQGITDKELREIRRSLAVLEQGLHPKSRWLAGSRWAFIRDFDEAMATGLGLVG